MSRRYTASVLSASFVPLVDPPVAQGQAAYTTVGTYSWTAPPGVTSVSVVCIGCALGYGGALAYKNNITVVPGTSYPVVIGPTYATRSSFNGDATVSAGYFNQRTGDGGGDGGAPGGVGDATYSNGSGGAGGYSGTGGTGGSGDSGGPTTGTSGSGGGGGGGGAGSTGYTYGGGTGLLGEGASGVGSAINVDGLPGSGGSGANYGGGYWTGASNGAVRIIWGANRAFPSTNTGDL